MARSISKGRPRPSVNLPRKGRGPKLKTVSRGPSPMPVDPMTPGPMTDHSTHTTADLSPETQAYAAGLVGGGDTPFSGGQ